jgi:toxin ParE1/3/4
MSVRWTLSAASDLTQICDYIERHGGGATARRVALSIVESVNQLAKFSGLGRTGRTPNTRELVLTGSPYLAVYRVRADDDVEILRILHGAQQWP